MFPIVALRTAFILPKAIRGERNVMLGQLAILAIGYQLCREAFLGFCFHVIVVVELHNSGTPLAATTRAPIGRDTRLAIGR